MQQEFPFTPPTFWDCFGTAPAKKGKSRAAALSKGVVCIR